MTNTDKPMIVLDPADPDAAWFLSIPWLDRCKELSAKMRAQIEPPAPPKPDEPQGLGAVVVDADGGRWTRTRSHDHALNWREEWGGRWRQWADIDAVTVLSEGIA